MTKALRVQLYWYGYDCCGASQIAESMGTRLHKFVLDCVDFGAEGPRNEKLFLRLPSACTTRKKYGCGTSCTKLELSTRGLRWCSEANFLSWFGWKHWTQLAAETPAIMWLGTPTLFAELHQGESCRFSVQICFSCFDCPDDKIV